jgi:hypothetical protein
MNDMLKYLILTCFIMINILISCTGCVRVMNMKTNFPESGAAGERLATQTVGGSEREEVEVKRRSEPVESGGGERGLESRGEAFAAVSASLALTPGQRKAIEMLTSGHTLVDSATAAGVGRTTLYRWLKGDAKFLAVYNSWQQDALATARGRLLAMSDLAVTTIGKAMSAGDAKTALAVLKALGVMERVQPGATDPDEVTRQQEMERKTREFEEKKKRQDMRDLSAWL